MRCRTCAVKDSVHEGKEQRRITRWEHEHVVDAVQARLDQKSAMQCVLVARRSSIRLAR